VEPGPAQSFSKEKPSRTHTPENIRLDTRIYSMRFPFVLALAVSLFWSISIARGVAHNSSPINPEISRRPAQAHTSPWQGSASNQYRGNIHPLSPRVTLTIFKSLLGPTKLVAFASSDGLCVEVDHPSLRSHAGACSFRPSLPGHRQLLAASIGFSAGLGQNGVSELIGMARPTVQLVQVSYVSDARRRHLSVPVGELPRSILKRTDAPASRWFAFDVPGCLESHNVRIRAFGPHHSFLGSAKGFDQHAACQAGIGYKARAAVIYGSLPPS
jgi:hypothetical protein